MTDHCATDHVQTWKCPNKLFKRTTTEIIQQVNRTQLRVRSIVAYCAVCSQEDDMLQEENVERATSFLLHCFKESHQNPTSHVNCETVLRINSEVNKVWLEILSCVSCIVQTILVSLRVIYEKLCSLLNLNLFSKVQFVTFQHSQANEEKSRAKQC